MADAQTIIEQLALQPHPEGGWYRETWRADASLGERAVATAIYFLLESGQRSHWHKVDAAELWLWHAGAPLTLLTAPDEAGPVSATALGPEIGAGQRPQLLVPPHHWQSTETTGGGWALVSCIVAPAFDFAGFTLAAPGWAPGVA